ncbi:MAG: methyltransferase domain-containing protein [Ferruginibacter sp.]
MHLNSKLLIQKYGLPYFKDGLSILEIGPDNIPSTIQQMVHNNVTWHTLNIFDDKRLTYSNSAEYSFPIQDNTYDIVISANVIEHVQKIWKWIPELARITKQNGLVITVNPISWNYHEDPVDCWRIYPEGMKALYEEAGLKVELSKFENLESMALLNRPYNASKMWPGVSLGKMSMIKKLKLRIGYPVMASIDTISIGRK